MTTIYLVATKFPMLSDRATWKRLFVNWSAYLLTLKLSIYEGSAYLDRSSISLHGIDKGYRYRLFDEVATAVTRVSTSNLFTIYYFIENANFKLFHVFVGVCRGQGELLRSHLFLNARLGDVYNRETTQLTNRNRKSKFRRETEKQTVSRGIEEFGRKRKVLESLLKLKHNDYIRYLKTFLSAPFLASFFTRAKVVARDYL